MKKSKLFKFSFGLLALLLFSSTSFAQRKITVVVEDAKTNSPMAGATIPVRGSKTSAISKEGGNLRLRCLQKKNFLQYLLWGKKRENAKTFRFHMV